LNCLALPSLFQLANCEDKGHGININLVQQH
jgi:hypothetical protein